MSAIPGVTQPPYPLHESVRDLLDPEYVAFYNKHVINTQQVHLQPVAASRTSGVLIPGAGPMMKVGKTQDMTIHRRATEGPAIPIRCFTPEGKVPPGGWPVMLYFHGGGWVLGNIDTENVVCSNLCVRANCVVVTVAYRYVPCTSFGLLEPFESFPLTSQSRTGEPLPSCGPRLLGIVAMVGV